MLLKFQLMRHFDKSVCCRENTEGYFEQKSVATKLITSLDEQAIFETRFIQELLSALKDEFFFSEKSYFIRDFGL